MNELNNETDQFWLLLRIFSINLVEAKILQMASMFMIDADASVQWSIRNAFVTHVTNLRN